MFLLIKSKINSNYLKKYALQKNYLSIPLNLIKQISKKILLALQFLYSKNLYFGKILKFSSKKSCIRFLDFCIIFQGHLHTGNVLIEASGNTVRLTDIQNGLLGLPFFYRAYVVEHRRIQVNKTQLII